MNEFGERLERSLAARDLTLEELPEELLDHGADNYDVATLDATLRGPLAGGDRLGWHPNIWAALSRVLGHPEREEMLPLLWAFNGLPSR